MEANTLREYFAGIAMQSLLQKCTNPNPDKLAKTCVKVADAMIKELNVPPTSAQPEKAEK